MKTILFVVQAIHFGERFSFYRSRYRQRSLSVVRTYIPRMGVRVCCVIITMTSARANVGAENARNDE